MFRRHQLSSVVGTVAHPLSKAAAALIRRKARNRFIGFDLLSDRVERRAGLVGLGGRLAGGEHPPEEEPGGEDGEGDENRRPAHAAPEERGRETDHERTSGDRAVFRIP